MLAYHTLPADRVLSELASSELGLSPEEAEARLKKYGPNALRKKKKAGALRLFLAQFKDFMTILLICAAALSGAIAYLTGDAHELADTGILLFIILLNTFVGFIQQYRADNAIEKLKSLSVCRVRAVRGGRDVLLDGEELVPGDIVCLEEGDKIPADCRILTAESAACDESALTGESRGAAKDTALCPENAALSDCKNMLFASTFLVRGTARAVVVRTGSQTEIGKIADLLEETPPAPTPLERTLATLGKILTAFVLSVAAVLFVFSLLVKHTDLLPAFMSSIAVAVAAIPEGMPAVVTVIMAMGVQKMSRERAIVRKLHAVETLGSCSCICSDKTGTLTQNRMTVEQIYTQFTPDTALRARTSPSILPRDFQPREEGERKLLLCMAACNTVKGARGRRMGDATEVALVNFADGCAAPAQYRTTGSIPFSSERRLMTVGVHTSEGIFDLCKGAPDAVLARCDFIFAEGRVRPLTPADREGVRAVTASLAARALRVLAFAWREGDGKPREEGLIFAGVAGMIDPPKEGVKEAVESCHRAGIDAVMITGDHSGTAGAIAARLGISEGEVLTGADLEGMDEAERRRRIPDCRVFARVSPAQKSMIVGCFREAGNVVAMTGDGINDAPGLAKADIGIAMGSGTDVTKSAADMVIADDNFATIVSAVREGRRIFSNIKKTIRFFLATNLAEVLSILLVTLFLYRLDFLNSTQLLWINLITDSLPVLSLGTDAAEENVMKTPPCDARELFSAPSMLSVLFYGCVQTAITVGVFVWAAGVWSDAVAVTMTFFVLSFLELFHSFNIRSERASAFGRGFFSNRMLFLTVALGIAVNVPLCLFAPLRAAFSLAALSPLQWGIVFAASLAVLPAAELYKLLLRVLGRKKRAPRRAERSVLFADHASGETVR